MIELIDLADDAIDLADIIEVIVMASDIGILSQLDVIDYLRDTPPDDVDDAESNDGGLSGTSWDLAQETTEAAFRELISRAQWLGDRYPFFLEDDVLERVNDASRSSSYRFLAMLRARQLFSNRLSKDEPADVGSIFERLCEVAVDKYVNGSVVRFGVAGGGRGGGLPIDLPAATVGLARRMSEVAAAEIPPKIGWDYKADVIAWRGFGDHRPGQLVVICQATISENEWFLQAKQIPPKWTGNRLIQFLAPIIPAAAFIESLSKYSTSMLNGMPPPTCIPLDRFRLISVCSDDDFPNDLLEEMNSWSTWAIGKLST